MAILWRLKTYLANKHGIFGAVKFQKKIVKETGVLISVQNLCNYLENKPKSIRLKTIEIICSALDCEMQDFCEVKPKPQVIKQNEEPQKLSYQNTPHNKRAVKQFPNPKDYSD